MSGIASSCVEEPKKCVETREGFSYDRNDKGEIINVTFYETCARWE